MTIGSRGSRVSIDFTWVPDSQASACHSCHAAFTFFRRKHHCRLCGRIFCDSCSNKRLAVDKNADQSIVYRACNACYDRVLISEQPIAVQSTDDPSTDIVLYKTQTLCICCSLIEQRGFDPVDADVRQIGSQIFLERRCSRHPSNPVLYCSNASFFRRMFQYDRSWFNSNPEDLIRSRHQQPITVTLRLFSNGRFMTIDAIDAFLQHFCAIHDPEMSFIVTCDGGLLPNLLHVKHFNKLICHMVSSTSRCLFDIELPFDRLRDISLLHDSCLLKGRVFPSVRYFLTDNGQSTAVKELSELVSVLRNISDIKLCLKLSFFRDYPDLKLLLSFAQSHRDIIRYFVFSPTRSNKELLLQATKPDVQREPLCDSVDPVTLIDHICQAKGLARSDFFPLCVFQMLEPFFALLDIPRCPMKMSPFCAFICPISFKADGTVYPLARLVDVPALHGALMPLVEQWRQGGPRRNDRSQIRQSLQSLLQSFSSSSPLLNDILSILSCNDPVGLRRLQEFSSSLQYLIIQNNMDIGSMDLRRQCQCSDALKSLPAGSSAALSASCIGDCL